MRADHPSFVVQKLGFRPYQRPFHPAVTALYCAIHLHAAGVHLQSELVRRCNPDLFRQSLLIHELNRARL